MVKDVLIIEKNECGDCEFCKTIKKGWYCVKKEMRLTPKMRMSFRKSQGTCFQAKKATV